MSALRKSAFLSRSALIGGTACEHLGELQAGFGDVIHLVDGPDQRGRERKGLGAEIVLRMNVGGDEIQPLVPASFFATSYTAVPFRGPSPVSITSTARSPMT